jgi:hypothetical protein
VLIGLKDQRHVALGYLQRLYERKGLINVEVESGGLHKNAGERRERFPKI